MSVTQRFGAAGLTIVIAFIAAAGVNWSSNYHSGWREGSSAALSAVGLLATLGTVAAIAVALRDSNGMHWRFSLLVGTNAAIAVIFVWQFIALR